MLALMNGRTAFLVICVCASGAILVGAAFMTGRGDPLEAQGSELSESNPIAEGTVAQAGLRAYVDSAGNVVPRPEGAPAPSFRARTKVIPVQRQSTVPGGGVYIDTRHIRAVSYATVSDKGEISLNCITVHGADIEEGLASRGIAHGHNHDIPSSQ